MVETHEPTSSQDMIEMDTDGADDGKIILQLETKKANISTDTHPPVQAGPEGKEAELDTLKPQILENVPVHKIPEAREAVHRSTLDTLKPQMDNGETFPFWTIFTF